MQNFKCVKCIKTLCCTSQLILGRSLGFTYRNVYNDTNIAIDMSLRIGQSGYYLYRSLLKNIEFALGEGSCT